MRSWQHSPSTAGHLTGVMPSIGVEDVRLRSGQFTDFMLGYKFAIDEVVTKINILREDFNHANAYNPIEHITSRLKAPESVLEKVRRKGYAMNLASIRENVLDIAGVRVICSFISDIGKIRDMLVGQEDVTLLDERDYITNRKPNGYQSLHLIVSIPVFRAERTVRMPVEIQIRTIAMDFWASLEHKIYYKYRGEVPANLQSELTQAADAATQLDEKMEALHHLVNHTDEPRPTSAESLDLEALYETFATDRR
ncbi:GTP pyrophosphokinase family protein [Actinophytocola sp.]|uniref:GTP pyrophosphokinase n=1 Tax=Actinophytocola sp. TaxID=1872138 RepID=UPI00389A0018